jgi:glutamate-1-semialdehyde 2,1-aminomutase
MTYPDPASKSAALYARGANSMPGGNSRTGVMFEPYPLYAAHGQGCRITDVDGVERIDFINNWSSLIHGHGNDAIQEAIADQATRLLAVGMPTEVEIELAELLVDRLDGVDKIRFSNSGSEGVLMALRAARAFTGRDKIAKAEGAYHGNADSIEISVAPARSQSGPADAPISVPATHGIPASVVADTIVLPFNDAEASRRLLEQHGADLAAVIIDPVVSRVGFVRASAEYLSMLRQLTEEIGALLIFDEVFSFRIGYGGAQREVGVVPDLTALGKIIGGGLPVGATGGRADIMDVFDQTRKPLKVEHGGTYNANPLTMAAGLACMKQMTPSAYQRLDALGDRLRDGLRDCLTEFELAGQVVGVASLAALIFNDQPFDNYRDMPLRRREAEMIYALHRHLLNHGVQIVPHGLMILSTAMTDDDIDEVLHETSSGMKELAVQFGSDAD